MEYKTIMSAELKVDVYAGAGGDKHQKYWKAYSDGDMDSEDTREPLKLGIRSFPPGTKVEVSVPCCPKCGLDQEMHEKDMCDFNWKDWVEDTYS